ncbi:hypothetical protein [Spirosoma sp. 209]|uniref:hypothetical protein n=1 Tax=Spirosoma sp. 209 TaxID=1955701 RepID=UPI00098D39EA|nr:hypothetical protein [Spirosoma sp. 209]
MKNRYVLLACLLGMLAGRSQAQTAADQPIQDSEWKSVAALHQQKGNWMVGAGLTLLGATARGGRFIANRTWVGVEAEYHSLIALRREGGVFARYYLWSGSFVSGFVGGGVTYGWYHDRVFNLDGSSLNDPAPYYSPKLNALVGVEYALGRRFSIEGVAKYGKLTRNGSEQPSLQGSFVWSWHK